MGRADIALALDRETTRVAAVLGERRAVGAHLRRDLGQRRRGHDQPGVAQPRRAPDRRLGLRRHPDRHAAPGRPQAQPMLAHLVKAAGVRHLGLGPEPAHEADLLVHPRRALGERHAEGGELALPVAEPHPKDIGAAAERVQRRRLLGDMHRVKQRQDQDARPHRHAPRLG
jgi:hypothetical protein